MPIISVSDTFAREYAAEVSKDYFGTVVKSGANAKGVYKEHSTRNGMLLEDINNTTLAYDALDIGAIRYPGGTESRYFRIGNAEDIAGLHRAIDYCARNDLSLNFTLHDTRYIKNIASQDVFLTAGERAELANFIQSDLIGYANSQGVEVSSIHLGNEFQGRAAVYGEPAWVGYAKVSAVLVNELDRIFDADPALQAGRPDFVIQPNNWQSQTNHDAFVDILMENIGTDGGTAASKVDAIDVHGAGSGGSTTTNTLELTWEDYFGDGDAKPYEDNIARMAGYWRDDPRIGDIGFRNDAWAYADTPNLKDAALGMLQIHTASEYGFDAVTNYIGYAADASALVREARDQSSTDLNITAGGVLFDMMRDALVGTKAATLQNELAPEKEALLPVLTRVFEGEDRIVVYLVNRTGAAMDIDLVTNDLIAGSADFGGGVATTSITILGSDDPTNGLGNAVSRLVPMNPSQLDAGQTDFTLGAYEIAQVTLTAAADAVSLNSYTSAPAIKNLSLQGGRAADILMGGSGADSLSGGGGHDTLSGGLGADYLNGGEGKDAASYETAKEGICVNLASPKMNTNDAAGDLYANIEHVIGGRFDDTLAGDRFANALIGGTGNDKFHETAGGDSIFGGSGAHDTLILDQRATKLSLHSGLNNKGLKVSGIEDVVAGSGADSIAGNYLANSLMGKQGDDYLLGFGGNDILSGNGGNDRIYGGKGNDTLIGGEGRDTLFGGAGRNRFLIYAPNEGGDTIGDFKYDEQSGDTLSLRAKSFGGLAAGQLNKAHFAGRENDTIAQDADDRFIYKSTDQTLWFDMDGTGTLPPSLLAKLDGEENDKETTFSASLIWLF